MQWATKCRSNSLFFWLFIWIFAELQLQGMFVCSSRKLPYSPYWRDWNFQGGVGHSLRPNHCTCTTEVEGIGEKNPHHGGDLYRYFLDLCNGVLFILMIFRIRLKTSKLNLSAILTVTILVCLQYYTSRCSSVFSTVAGFISSLCFEMHFQINVELCEGDRCQIVSNE